MSLIFIFLDGVGLAPAGPDNPLSDAVMPTLCALLGGPLTIEQITPTTPSTRLRAGDHRSPLRHSSGQASIDHRPTVLLKPIDATLGMPGLPQSGTGQTALLAGVNAAELHGRHQPHFPPVALRPLLAERNVLRRVVDSGGRATFANAFGPGYWSAVAARRVRRSASVIAAEGAGLRFRDMDDLRAGRAVAWDVTGAAVHERELAAGLSPITPRMAGMNLARLANDHDLVFYESFLPDLAGHGRLTTDDRPPTTDHRPPTNDDGRKPYSVREQIHQAMSRLDGLIGGVLEALRPQDSLLITSDHGNIESYAAPAHTRNPVPLLLVGSAARAFVDVASIMDVPEVILSIVDVRS